MSSQIFDYLGNVRSKQKQLNEPLVSPEEGDGDGLSSTHARQRLARSKLVFEGGGDDYVKNGAGGDATPAGVQAGDDDGAGVIPGVRVNRSQLETGKKGNVETPEEGNESTEAAAKARSEAIDGIEKDWPEELKDEVLDKLQNLVAEKTEIEADYYHLIFEPKGCGQKCRAILQNSTEILMLVIVTALAIGNASALSVAFLLLTALLTVTANMAAERRMRYGLVINVALMGLLLAVTALKALHMVKTPVVYGERTELGAVRRTAELLGFQMSASKCKPVCAADDPKCCSYEFAFISSLTFDVYLAILYLAGIIRFSLTRRGIAKLQKQGTEVFMIKTFQQEDDEEQDKEMHIGTSKTSKQRSKVDENEITEEQKKQYDERMTEMNKSVWKNYHDSKYIQSFNKNTFLLMLFLQVVQAMKFNGVIDVPTILMLVIYQSMYSFRSSYFETFTRYSFFIAYYIKFVCMFKATHCILGNIGYLHYYNVHYPDSMRVIALKVLFGPSFGEQQLSSSAGQPDKVADKAAGAPEPQLLKMTEYYVIVLVCLMCSQIWLQGKWAQVREYQHNMPATVGTWNHFTYYINKIQAKKHKIELVRQEQKRQDKKRKEKDSGIMDTIKRSKKSQSRGALHYFKTNLNKHLPTTLMWAQRVLVGFQAYMYHTDLSLIHLTWVVMTFILPYKVMFFFSIVIMIPIYSFEFIMVYGNHVYLLGDSAFFQKYSMFKWTMENKMLEQLLFYVIMSNFFMMISGYFLTFQHNQDEMIIENIRKLMKDKNKSIIYKFGFWILKYIQSLVLIILLYMGYTELNHLANLMFMLFFVVYTAFINFYRLTSKSMTILFSYLICMRYFYSLNYHKFIKDKAEMYEMAWLGLFSCPQYTVQQVTDPNFLWEDVFKMCSKNANFPQWKEGSSIYFQHLPQAFDWIMMILMAQLNVLNKMFVDEEKSAELEVACQDIIRKKYPSQVLFGRRMRNWANRWMLWISLFVMVASLSKAQTNLITWVFFILNVSLMSLVARGGQELRTLKRTWYFSEIIKYYSVSIILIDIAFICFIGEEGIPNRHNSYDQQLQRAAPIFYKYLDFIGLRVITDPYKKPTPVELNHQLRVRFTSYIIYMLFSLYLSGQYQKKYQNALGGKQFTEDDYKRLFEIEVEAKKQKSVLDASITQTEEERDEELNREYILRDERRKAAQRAEAKKMKNQKLGKKSKSGVDESSSLKTSFYKQETYDKFDLLDRFEYRRYDTSFIAYKKMAWWPMADFIAIYGGVVGNMIIVYLSIYYNVSFLMAFNLFCICAYYMLAVNRLQKKAMQTYQMSGLLSQTDLKNAGIISKQFKITAFNEFLKVRTQVWKFQMAMFVLCAVAGFPSPLIQETKRQYEYEMHIDPVKYAGNQKLIDSINRATYWIFVSGIYKDHRAADQQYFYITFGLLIVSLFVERQAINWLTDRWGCTFNKLQKFIELDTRRTAIVDQWDVIPKYQPERYRDHYFYTDFDNLRMKFLEPEAQEEAKARLARRKSDPTGANKLSRKATELASEVEPNDDAEHKPVVDNENANLQGKDFVSYKQAVRIKDMITFTLKLDGRCPDLHIGNESKVLLEKIEEQRADPEAASKSTFVDYESVAVLKKHKIEMLYKILEGAVERKYKISFAKGMQLLLENICLFLLMISVVLKANVFALIYLIFIFKYLMSSAKQNLLVRMASYISLCLIIQYMMFVLNITDEISPIPFPSGLTGYPLLSKTDHPTQSQLEAKPKYPLPLFFQSKTFRDLRLGYLLGIGIEQDQLQNLFVDFFNLFLVSMYILNFRNPLLVKSVKKIFWQFPSANDDIDMWKRLDDDVKRQVAFLSDPVSADAPMFDKIRPQLEEMRGGLENAKQEFLFCQRYVAHEDNDQHHIDLNDKLITYIDLKYNQIWSTDFCKKIKWQIKDLCVYFRLVKQGSILVYLSFHVFTMCLILTMAVLRRSFLAMGYVIFILPNLKAGAEVLKQNLFAQDKQKIQLEDDIEQLKEEKKKKDRRFEEAVHYNNSRSDIDDDKKRELHELETTKKAHMDKQIDEKIEKINQDLREIKQSETKSKKTFEQKQDEKIKKAESQWKIIMIIKRYLLIYALLDFSCQIIAQLPVFSYSVTAKIIGLRKIYTDPHADIHGAFNYDDLLKAGKHYEGLHFTWKGFTIQILNCLMICCISLQSQIFDSCGYKKFMEQKGGSLDLLMELSELKARSITYVYNNHKIRKIVQIQKKREQILETVDKMKKRLAQWRRFMRTVPSKEQEEKQKEQLKYERIQAEEKEQRAAQGSRDLSIRVGGGSVSARDKRKSSIAEADVLSKSVQFHSAVEDSSSEGEGQEHEEDKKEERVDRPAEAKEKKITPEQSEKLQRELAKELVAEKKKKLNRLTRLYLFINNNFVEKIMFKNKKADLEQLLAEHSKGGVDIPTELDVIMLDEALFLIEQHYDNLEGKEMLQKLQEAKVHFTTPGTGSKKLLKKSNLDSKIKLQHMPRTWAFTRPCSMCLRLIESWFYVLISNTQNIIYLSMIFSMFQNSGFISLIYPFLVFGYAILEETRPNKNFWMFLRKYTICLLFFKFCVNLSAFGDFLNKGLSNKASASYKIQTVFGYIKPGIYNHADLFSIFMYMLPEILISCFIMLNEIHLKMVGLYYQVENEVEPIQDGIERTMQKGDFEALARNQVAKQHMNLAECYVSMEEQKENVKWQQEQEGIEVEESPEEQIVAIRRSDEADATCCSPEELQLRKKESQTRVDELWAQRRTTQNEILKHLAKQVQKGAREFDLDDSTANHDSAFDHLVSENAIQKSLESDHIIFVEGVQRAHRHHGFITEQEIEDDLYAELETKMYSAGDFQAEFRGKMELLDKKETPRLGPFERNKYFDKIFPSLKIQKPGYDLYASTTIFLGILLLYVFAFYGQMSVSQADYLKKEPAAGLFNFHMIILMLIIITIMFVERYANRMDTKAAKKKSEMMAEDQRFFKEKEMFGKSKTARSMTVKLKTMKTTDLDMEDDVAQDFLQAVFGGETDATDDTRTKITKPQKTKYIMHMLILVSVHIFVFWFVPIYGNFRLYGTSLCEPALVQYYSCKNFHQDIYLQIFYLIMCGYLLLSGLQLKYGFPIWKKTSSVMQYNNNMCAYIMAQVYYALPFIVELRCLTDFTMSKTSLDLFQFWQCFQYNFDMYSAKNSNVYYTEKTLGSATEPFDKCTQGVLIMTVLLVLVIGPLYFFSTIGGFVAPNPVLGGELSFALIIKKALNEAELSKMEGPGGLGKNSYSLKAFDFSQESMNALHRSAAHNELSLSTLNIYALDDSDTEFIEHNKKSNDTKTHFVAKQIVPFSFYHSKNPLLKSYNSTMFDASIYHNWTETRFFHSDQIQDAAFEEYAQTKWLISDAKKLEMREHLLAALNTSNIHYQFEFGVTTDFERSLPATARTASLTQHKQLNESFYPDCLTMQSLKEFAKLDCTKEAKEHKEQDPDATKPIHHIRFSQAVDSELILGFTSTMNRVNRKGHSLTNQLKDILVTFTCPDQFEVLISAEPTYFSDHDKLLLQADPLKQCAPPEHLNHSAQILNIQGQSPFANQFEWEQMVNARRNAAQINDQNQKIDSKDGKFIAPNNADGGDDNKRYGKVTWERVKFTLFSMLVSSSFFAAYDITTFYAGVVIVLGTQLRGVFLYYTFIGWQYETTHPDAIIKTIEAVYMYRHEENLLQEEETYRMVQEIVRQPELLKQLTGSSLKGEIEHAFENFSVQDKEKLKHIQEFDRLGFDVQSIREALIAKNEE